MGISSSGGETVMTAEPSGGEPAPSKSSGLPIVGAALAIFLLAVTSFYAYFRLFSSFAGADDEGWQMMTVHHFVRGYPLYDQVASAYGPLYYAFEFLIHQGIGVPITNDATRFITLVVWTVTAGIVACAAGRLTGRVAFGFLTYLLTAAYLTATRWEPGHPQELAALLLALGVLISLGARPERLGWWAAGAGAIAAGLALLKINLGAFATLSLLLVILTVSNPGRLIRAARICVAAVAVLFPFFLLKGYLNTSWGLSYALVVSCAVAALVVSAGTRPLAPAWPMLGLFTASFLATTALLCLFVFARGTTLHGLLSALVFLPRRMSQTFVFPTAIDPRAAPCAGIALVLALVHANRGRLGSWPFYDQAFALVKALFGAAVVWWAQRQAALPLLNFATPFLWLALTPGPAPPQERTALPRRVLCFLAALQALQVYPVPGSQYYIGTFLFLLAGVLCLADVLAWLAQRFEARPAVVWFCRLAPSLAVILSLALCSRLGFQAYLAYRQATPLDLPGAHRLRIDARRAAAYRWLAANLDRYADTFLCTTGSNSLYLWTGKEPPSRIGLGNVIDYCTEEQQRILVEALARYPNACVIYHKAYFTPLEAPSAHRTRVLLDYIDHEFVTCGRFEGFEFRVRKGRRVPGLGD